MGVISSKRTFTGCTTDVDDKSVCQHTMKWNVEVDLVTMTGIDVLVGGRSVGPDPVPDLYDLYPGDPYSRCKGLSAKQSQSTPLLWEVEAKYDSNYTTSEKQPVNPVLRPAVYTVEFQQFQRVIERDINGKQVCNSLKQTLVPALEAEDSRPVLVVQKNFSSLAQVVSLMLEYKDAINSAPFYGAAKHQAKIKSITAGQEQTENGHTFIPVTIRIEFQGAGDTWDKVILNTAIRFYRSEADIPSATNFGGLGDTIDGIRVTEPVPIDEKGIYIRRDPTTGELVKAPTYLTYQIFPERNFSLLNI